MSRLTAKFDALRAAKRKALVPYIVAGDPDMDMGRIKKKKKKKKWAIKDQIKIKN